ncbi:MAG: NYN domain-containing protein [Dermatophilaceae bacterium]
MRSYCAIYVDVGYLLASAATRVTGTSFRRGVTVDHRGLIQGLIDQAETASGLPLLRVNWYDSGARPGGMPDLHQDEIGLLPRVKLRLGRISHSGEQKGVDLRIGLDLATHGRNRVVDVIYLVSGDDDLTEAVEEAQGHGVQVVILAVPDHAGRPYAVARHLQREADGLLLIDPETITHTVRSVAIAPGLIPESAAAEGENPGAGEGTLDLDEIVVEETAVGDSSLPTTPEAPRPRRTATPDAPVVPAPLPSAPGHSPADRGRPGVGGIGIREEEPLPAGEEESSGGRRSVPSPSMLANKRPSGVQPPKALPPQSTLTWSTTTGQGTPPVGADGEITAELIDAVVRQVVMSWCASATPDALIDLRRGKPFIAGDLDRTLLLDLSSRSGVPIIDDVTRFALRDRFWEVIDRVRLT